MSTSTPWKLPASPETSLEWRLLYFDLAGQAYLLAMSGDFPRDQRAFAKLCIQQGLDRALIATARQQRRAS